MGFYCPIEFKDNSRTIEPRFPKNSRTNEARSDFTGYKTKKVHMRVWLSGLTVCRPIISYLIGLLGAIYAVYTALFLSEIGKYRRRWTAFLPIEILSKIS